MDGGGKWWMLNCAGGVQHETIINGMMLRFRPIAPKPAAGDSAPGGPLVGNKDGIVLSKRKKRKYVRVSRNIGNRKKKTNPDLVTEDCSKDIVTTLPLMPEKADLDFRNGFKSVPGNPDSQISLNLERKIPVPDEIATSAAADLTALTPHMRAVEAWVTVDSLTGTCMDDGALGSTDVEKMKNLDMDTCPGFISDGSNRVLWVNDAFKRMVDGGVGGAPPSHTVVWLMIKEGLLFPQYVFRTFSCHVRVQYTCKQEKNAKMVPCDVWRMECGGFAWRLDVQAALSLGL